MRVNVSLKRTLIINALGVFFLYFILVVSIFYFFQPSISLSILTSSRTIYSLGLSLFAATAATVMAIILAIPSAYALSRYDFRLKTLIDTFLELPLVVSPAALGAMVLIFFNNPAGSWINEHAGNFTFTVSGVILAQLVTVLGIAVRLIKAVMDEVPVRYEHVARSLGASPYYTLKNIVLPICKGGIISASILTWAKAFGEFGATITIAGSIPNKTETLPIAIFMRLSSADIEGTVVMILISIIIGLGILHIYKRLSHQKGIPHA
jgi:molybdate transport system permease protein